MKNRSIRIVHISDMHLFANKQQALLGVKTYDSFSALVALLKNDPQQPDVIILSGDLSQDNSRVSYQYLADFLKDFSCPIYFIPGNHDEPSLMTEVLTTNTISPSKHILLDGWHVILLNSQKQGEVPGFLNETQLEFLKTCLEQYPKHQAIIVFHHHPIPVGTEWLDPLGLKNADQFWDLLQSYPHVHSVLFGHVHQVHEGQKNGIRYFSAPSTCIQFKKNSAQFQLEQIGPGYRWLDLYPNGELKTDVVRVDHYVGEFDKHATGY